MRNRRLAPNLQRRRQLNRQQTKMINRRQEYFVQSLVNEKSD